MADLAFGAALAFLQPVFQFTANFLKEEVRLMQAFPKEIKNLEETVNMINATLNDAKMNPSQSLMINATLNDAKMNPSQSLKLWLDGLRDVAYEAIDLLDEYNTELLRRDLVHAAKLRDRISPVNPNRLFYENNMSHKIKDLSSRVKEVIQKRSDLVLNVNESSPTSNRLEITTSLPPTHIIGREDEMTEILLKLIPYNDVQVGIFAIHGLGRIGKTTLAQSIYKEIDKKGDFNMTLWVQVSYEFDLEKVTRSILDSMGERQVRDMDTAQKLIQMKLEGKRYLLVLDDFSNENIFEWEKLIRPLQKGAPGSIIIVTTGTELVAKRVSPIFSLHLKELSGNNWYSLVCHYASRNNTHAIAKLNAQRSEIINKCKGMPEEAINLGVQLSHEHDEEKWNEIIVKWGEGHTSSEESRSINSMRLHNLPSNLKSCLAFCSIIPKGKQFKKDWIIQLWMAQNFIVKQNQQRIEDIGNTYFDWLVARSFFQKTGISLNKDRYEYHIPNMVHDAVQYISAEECCIFEFGKSDKPPNSTRHISIIVTREQLRNTLNLFTKIYHCKELYTLLVVGDFVTNHPLHLPNDIFNRLGKLRTLDLSNCNLGSLPKNIGDLKYLRCLQLQNSNIQELPKSVGDLYNLQTLGLRNCYSLRKLPKKIKCLQKLLHLDLHLDHLHPNDDQRLESMPPYIGLLTNLQVLSRFVVSKRKHCGLNELRNLNSLQGGLSISNLDLVKNFDDAAKANLREKIHIKRLEFLWRRNRVLHERSNEREITELVLENLKPSSSIKELSIVGYTGGVLPSWLESVSLPNLHAISLSDCINCIDLPPLGNLPMLQDLYIKGMHSVKSINCNFCGKSQIRFRSLKKLVMENMAIVETWTGDKKCELSNLSELVLKDCANLKRLTHNFPKLKKLTIEKLPKFIDLCGYPSLEYLKVVEFSDWISGSGHCLSSLLSLTLSQIPSKTLPANLLKELNSLRSLEISHCDYLTMLPDDWIPSGVTCLCIRQCLMLREMPKRLESLKALEDLVIQDCKNLVSLPKLKNLKSLTRLEMSDCYSFEFLPSDGLPDALHFLSISNCPLFSKQFEDFRSADHIKIKHVSSVWIDQKHLTSHRTQGESSTWRI